MAFFTPLEPPRELPRRGIAIERAVMDLKVIHHGTDFHLAKDVGAFANHLGGTLLIGAKETDGHLERYVGMSETDAANIRDRFSKAVRERCEPTPRYDFAEYPHPDDPALRVVAVNVWPSLLLLGVLIKSHKPDEGYGGDSFVYPVRAGTDALYLSPSQISMYMTPHVRRVAVLLGRIPTGTRVDVAWPGQTTNVVLDEVKEEENLVTFRNLDQTRAPNVPLDCIRTVYEVWSADPRPTWRMVLTF